jgi:uncharacterized protein YdcH (DUF465 family)
LNEKIHSLKVSDNHFRKLFDQYHEINNAIHRIETGAEVVADEVLNDYRLKRVHLKDELYELLTKN